jgi:hypothetical protein
MKMIPSKHKPEIIIPFERINSALEMNIFISSSQTELDSVENVFDSFDQKKSSTETETGLRVRVNSCEMTAWHGM